MIISQIKELEVCPLCYGHLVQHTNDKGQTLDLCLWGCPYNDRYSHEEKMNFFGIPTAHQAA